MSNFNLKLNLFLAAAQFMAARASSVRPFIKTLNRITRFRTGWYSDDHEELDRIFQAMSDPWNFASSPYEQYRLQVLLQEVARLPHDRVCEIGCAEGMFTEKLSSVCPQVTAIDVSPTAIHRARARCSTPRFHVTSLEAFQPNEHLFDLVVCAETLYYMKDVPGAIRKLSSLGRYCLVSYLEREAKALDKYFTGLPDVLCKTVEFDTGVLKRRMVCITWRNPNAKVHSVRPDTRRLAVRR